MTERERLIESLLEAEGTSPAERAEERAALESFLDTARGELTPDTSDWSDIREGALVGRVLARTTREDLSWRGELRLVSGFVRDRLAGSVLLRIVAASLVLHLIALPSLAWYLYRRPSPEATPRIGFAPPEEGAHFDDEAEPEVDVVDPVAEDGGAGIAHERGFADAVANTLRRSRFVLSRARLGVPEALRSPRLDPARVTLETRLIQARLRLLGESAWSAWLDESDDWMRAGARARALWAEVLLDRFVLEDIRSPQLSPLMSRIEREDVGRSGALGDLARAALGRARASGVWPAPTGYDPRSVELPLARSWYRALSEGFSDPLLETLGLWIRN